MARYTVKKNGNAYDLIRNGEFFASVNADKIKYDENAVAFFKNGQQIIMFCGEIEVL